MGNKAKYLLTGSLLAFTTWLLFRNPAQAAPEEPEIPEDPENPENPENPTRPPGTYGIYPQLDIWLWNDNGQLRAWVYIDTRFDAPAQLKLDWGSVSNPNTTIGSGGGPWPVPSGINTRFYYLGTLNYLYSPSNIPASIFIRPTIIYYNDFVDTLNHKTMPVSIYSFPPTNPVGGL
jgi:hypothetical protein